MQHLINELLNLSCGAHDSAAMPVAQLLQPTLPPYHTHANPGAPHTAEGAILGCCQLHGSDALKTLRRGDQPGKRVGWGAAA